MSYENTLEKVIIRLDGEEKEKDAKIAELEKERFTFKKIISNPAMAEQEKYVHIRDMLKEQGE